MKISNASVVEAVKNFSQEYTQGYLKKFQHLPITERDENWPSPCEQGIHQELYSLWKPVEVMDDLSFDNVESALEMTIHNDIKDYFSTIYCDSLDAYCEEGDLSLLFAWNQDDFARLQQNIIGHILMKNKLKQKLTIFFAVTDDDDHIISLDNESGEVWVEKVGSEAHKKLADSLADFVSSLSPRLPPSQLES